MLERNRGWAAIALVALGCGTAAGSSDAGADSASGGTDDGVVGTITMPAGAMGRCVMIAVDTDTSGSTGVAMRTDKSPLIAAQAVTGTTMSFTIDRVPPGTYFLWAYVDKDGSASTPPNCAIMGAPTPGDQFGYFGTGLNPPGAANVVVPHATGMRFDFMLGTIP